MSGYPPKGIVPDGWKWDYDKFDTECPAGSVGVKWELYPFTMWRGTLTKGWYMTLWFGGEMDPSDPLDATDALSVINAISTGALLTVFLTEHFPDGPSWLS